MPAVRMLLPSSLPACACVRVRVCTRDGMRKGKRGRRPTSRHQDRQHTNIACARAQPGEGRGGEPWLLIGEERQVGHATARARHHMRAPCLGFKV